MGMNTTSTGTVDCRLPKELEVLADVIADILAREFLRKEEFLTKGEVS